MFGIKNYAAGYHYETRVLEYGDFWELRKMAKKLNRRYKKNRRLERFGVYPIPGRVCQGQLVVMF